MDVTLSQKTRQRCLESHLTLIGSCFHSRIHACSLIGLDINKSGLRTISHGPSVGERVVLQRQIKVGLPFKG